MYAGVSVPGREVFGLEVLLGGVPVPELLGAEGAGVAAELLHQVLSSELLQSWI